MPVKPERRALYGDDWREFAAYIKFDRAEGKCECDGRCGDSLCRGLAAGRCNAQHGKPHPVNGKRTVLTAAHLNHDETSREEDEVAAFCARCHLAYDRDHHAETRKKTLEAKRAAILAKAGYMAFAIECETGRKIGR